MNQSSPNTIEFKFKWHDQSDAPIGIKGGTGYFVGSYLKLGDLNAELGDLIQFTTDGSHFYFDFLDDENNHFPVHIEVFGTDVQFLEQAIQAGRSAAAASKERERLSLAGELNSYRDQTCPFCKSTIMLIGLPETDQVFCEYCNSLFSIERDDANEVERYFRICEGCGMYSRPRQFSIFYFYFLVVTFGFHHDTTIRCSACMRSSSWKMVFGNICGLLGFPFALMQLYRSYSTSKLVGKFAGLDDANILARKRKIDKALEQYDLIMDNAPENAGVKYNIAFGLLLKKDYPHAQQMFELSLDDCSNYWPAVNGLIRVLKIQGKTKELEAVQKLWGFGYDTRELD